MRIMAIDYGDAHTGVAVSDALGMIAGYTTVINAYREEAVIDELQGIINAYQVGELVLGYPKNMDGSCGPRAEKAERFKKALEEATGLPVTLWDERRSTVEAHDILLGAGKNAKKRKKIVDAVAASLILEGYLQFRRK